jgi:hypothetical protein
MALWGNNDSKTASGTVQIYANGLVSGTSTSFTTQARVGDFIQVANVDYMVATISNNTVAQVVGQYNNTSVTAQNSGSSYNLGEKPKYTLMDANYNIGDPNNIDLYANYSNTVYGVDTTEATVSNGALREVVFTSYGSGYTANATVTVAGGLSNTVAATANAQSNSSGRITAINFSNNGAGYTSLPTLTVSAPSPIYFNGNVTSGAVVLGNATSDSTTFKLDNGYIVTGSTNTAFLSNGDIVTYLVQASNTAVGGLTSGSQYYVYTINSTAIALYTKAGGVNAYINLASTGTGPQANHSLTGQTAQVVPILSGVKSGTHAGWVKRTVGTGGRAGRVTYETLVAMATIAGDAPDDNVFPDA